MKKSAGILVYRKRNEAEVLLIHHGGPYWQNKDENSWSIPKGEIENDNELQEAIREFEEETGLEINQEDKNNIFYLGEVKSPNKIVEVFCLEKDFGDNMEAKSKFVEIEWPPGSGKIIKVPEVDKMQYFDLETAKIKLVNYQKPIIDLLLKNLRF